MEFPVSSTYLLNNKTKFLVNNQLLSDVTFLVGIEQAKIYGHRFLLALGSNLKLDKI